jgi:hypothetical protein
VTRGSGRRLAGPAGVAAISALAVAALVLGACTPSPSATVGPVETASLGVPASGNGEGLPSSPVDGVLTHIDSTGLTQVTGFDMRTADGRTLAFRIGTLENGAQFPPGHLAEHLATSAPVRVWFRPQGTDLVVYRLEDAPAS